MACVVAATDGRTVVLGGDGAGMCNGLCLRTDPPVFTRGPYAIGLTDSRMGQILRYHREIPYPEGPENNILDAFMATTFVPDLRSILVEDGRPGAYKQRKGDLLCVGLNGTIFLINDDLHVSRSLAPYVAIGSGAPAALGALHALHAMEAHPPPKAAVRIAMEAAETFSPGVGRPFHLVESTYNGEER